MPQGSLVQTVSSFLIQRLLGYGTQQRLSFYNHFSDKLVCGWGAERKDNLTRLQDAKL